MLFPFDYCTNSTLSSQGGDRDKMELGSQVHRGGRDRDKWHPGVAGSRKLLYMEFYYYVINAKLYSEVHNRPRDRGQDLPELHSGALGDRGLN